jgi:hypothetical protein
MESIKDAASQQDWEVAVAWYVSIVLDVQWLRSKDRHAVTLLAVSNSQSPETLTLVIFLWGKSA